jgi:hypothetical protein
MNETGRSGERRASDRISLCVTQLSPRDLLTVIEGKFIIRLFPALRVLFAWIGLARECGCYKRTDKALSFRQMALSEQAGRSLAARPTAGRKVQGPRARRVRVLGVSPGFRQDIS